MPLVEHVGPFEAFVDTTLERSGVPWLLVKLPELEHPVVFAELLGI